MTTRKPAAKPVAAKKPVARKAPAKKPTTKAAITAPKRGSREWTLAEATRIEASLQSTLAQLDSVYEALDVVYTTAKQELRSTVALVKTLSK